MEDESRLADGKTYTIRFYPDPAVFGTDVAARDASAGIDVYKRQLPLQSQ